LKNELLSIILLSLRIKVNENLPQISSKNKKEIFLQILQILWYNKKPITTSF
jgi:hypothetical protein